MAELLAYIDQQWTEEERNKFLYYFTTTIRRARAITVEANDQNHARLSRYAAESLAGCVALIMHKFPLASHAALFIMLYRAVGMELSATIYPVMWTREAGKPLPVMALYQQAEGLLIKKQPSKPPRGFIQRMRTAVRTFMRELLGNA